LSVEPAVPNQRKYIEGISKKIQDLVLDGESDAAFLKIQKERKCSALVAEEIRKEITEQLSQVNSAVDLSKAAPSHAPKKLIAVVVGAAIVLAIVTCNSSTTDTRSGGQTVAPDRETAQRIRQDEASEAFLIRNYSGLISHLAFEAIQNAGITIEKIDMRQVEARGGPTMRYNGGNTMRVSYPVERRFGTRPYQVYVVDVDPIAQTAYYKGML
jgi:hypothetical protein